MEQVSLFYEPPDGKRKNVLVACEESQAVCKAFRELGHRAFSCDLQPCSGGHPEWHILGDCLPLINGNCDFVTMDGKAHRQDGEWDILIAHPPCTYLSNAGACRLYERAGVLNYERYKKGIDGKAFFMSFLFASCSRIAIENPIPSSVYGLPRCAQTIEPYQFGEPWSKKTCLWLKGLPLLVGTEYISDYRPYIPCGTSRNKGNREKYGADRCGGSSRTRSKTFLGIARAMAEQWGGIVDGT